MPIQAHTTDILIAGGSFAGLALAVALSQQSGGDLKVAVVSPNFPPNSPRQPSAAIRASALSKGSLHLLDNLGLWQSLEPYAQRITSIDLTDSDLDDARRPTRLTYDLQSTAELLANQAARGDSGIETDLPKMVIIENHHLGAALSQAAQAATGITLHAGTSITTFAANLDSVRAGVEQ